MRNYPKITIIIPVKNSGKTLQKTFDSLKLQSYKNLEVIVMDGLSSDNTMEIINSNSDIVDIIISEKDESSAGACNKAIGISSGDIIGFLYGDDYLVKNALSTIAEAARKSDNFDIISYGLSIENLETKKILLESKKKKNISLNLNNILFKHVLNHFYRRDIFKKYGYLMSLYYDNSIFYSNDREFLIRLALNNVRNFVIEKTLYKMTHHKNSHSGSRSGIVKIREEHIGIAEYYLKKNNLSKYKKNKLIDFKSHNLALLIVWYLYKINLKELIVIFKKGYDLKGFYWFIDIFKCPLSELAYRASVKKWN